ncbi:MAG: B12-binding domain-containing radical SAM protein [Planctomycetes bacterium]|nr:B12-binding domain-containing radical SAM protein [Planctomycetota bacterium]
MKARNILLVHPSKKLLGKEDPIYTNESLTPALGLGVLSGYLRDKGVECKIVDLRLPHRSIQDVYNYIEEARPLLVGVTAFTAEAPAANVVAEKVKARWPHVPVVLGGPHATAVPEDVLKSYPNIDVCVLGEGEETTLHLVETLSGRNGGLSQVKGIAYRTRSGRVKINEPRPQIDDLDSLPFPAWDLFEIKSYNDVFMVSSSRGCPYPCYFCTPSYLGRKTRVRDFRKVVDEIKHIVNRFGARKIQFADATLSLMEENTHRLCQEMIDCGLNKKIEWVCETRADSVDQPLLEKMKESGCRWIALGVETGDERILKEVIRKGEDKEHIRNAVRLAKKVGIKVRCFFLFGHYTETVETIQNTINFALELNPDALSFGLLVPNPGSQFRKMAVEGKSGMRVLHNRWEDYNQFNYDCYELDNIPLAELKKWQSKAYYAFYMRHPIKGMRLFLDDAGYNYNLKALFTIPLMLLRNMVNGRSRPGGVL